MIPEAMDVMTRPKIMGKFLIPDSTADVPLMAWNQIGM